MGLGLCLALEADFRSGGAARQYAGVNLNAWGEFSLEYLLCLIYRNIMSIQCLVIKPLRLKDPKNVLPFNGDFTSA